jgi:hypothetical protein
MSKVRPIEREHLARRPIESWHERYGLGGRQILLGFRDDRGPAAIRTTHL